MMEITPPTAFQLISLLTDGAIFGILSTGVYVAFRWTRFPDLNPDGSFPLGAALFVVASKLGSIPVGLIAGLIGGAISGAVTALVCCRLRVPSVVSGLVVSSALYSVVWMLLRGSYQPLNAAGKIGEGSSGLGGAAILFGICLALVVVVLGCLVMFSETFWGLRLRAIGENPGLARELSTTVTKYTIVGLCIANGLAGLAGALMVQRTYGAHLDGGIGVTLSGIAGMMIGVAIVRFGIERQSLTLSCVLVGAIIERSLSFFTTMVGVPGSIFHLIGALLLLIVFFCASTEAQSALRGLRWT